MRAFIDWCGLYNEIATSLIRNGPESEIAESTLRTRSEWTGRRDPEARRADCAFLARLVVEHRLEEDEALEVAQDLSYKLVKKAYRL